ncbi:TIGR01777 family oxidoreductase [Rhodopirellula sp. P2]|uniref:TIGR01777 family oxidoreductase n=1 Tax=Rhodopirellula sp. P2 TaxID=2127060 RepID=UPI002368ECC8|nr:TIGR01777 family oxidoreductase [Rhodopirellula sp. P2]WDQ19505.1 TIGR01777 family oxidoreductase [Rhodopirellula sp. P2]
MQSDVQQPSVPDQRHSVDLPAECQAQPGTQHYIARVDLPVSIDQAFAYHERPGCLNRLTPPWEQVQLEHSDQSLAPGSRVTLKTKIAGIPVRWRARHVWCQPPHGFADVQDSGPFSRWCHQHRFESLAPKHSQLTDAIEYKLPAGMAGKLLGSGKARRTIEAMFAYRHRVTQDDLQMLVDYPMSPKTIAVSGASGLVGGGLCTLLSLLGHKVVTITRDEHGTEDQHGKPSSIAAWGSPPEFAKFETVDVVIHLAGKSVAGKRWTPKVKQQIRESRVEKTRALCEGLAQLKQKPAVLICASATGFYGDRGEEVLTETSSSGDDFLSEVAGQWEDACQPAREAGIRVVNTRFGMVLSPQGGALQQMLLPAKLMGGKLGDGNQWWSWIALDDVLGAIVHCIHHDEISGPVNFVAPAPIRNREFAKTLGQVLNRPAIFPAPKFGLRLALGEMAEVLLLASSRVIPERLQQTGYAFRFPELKDCLRTLLGKERKPSATTDS